MEKDQKNFEPFDVLYEKSLQENLGNKTNMMF